MAKKHEKLHLSLMIYFIEHPGQIRVMGDASCKIAQEKFDADEVNQRLLKILEI